MRKRLKNTAKNKKGFTLVELIVVIVIMLILGGTLVPSAMRYVDSARKANCKANASEVFTDVQTQIASYYSGLTEQRDLLIESNGIIVSPHEVLVEGVLESGVEGITSVATYKMDENYDLSEFYYTDGTYYVTWTMDQGWSEPMK